MGDPNEVDYPSYENMTDDEYEDVVRSYLWPNQLESLFVGIFCVVFLVGVIGNTLVVMVVISKRTMWSSMNIVLANLACADLLVLLFCLPPTVINDVTKTFWFSNVACKSIIFFQNTSVYVSIQSLVFISFERWRAITYPLKRPIRATRKVIAGTWVLSIVLSLPEPITLNLQPANFTKENFTTTWGTRCMETWSADFERRYQVFMFLVFYLMPLLLISYLCFHMRNTLRSSELKIGKLQLAHRRKAIRMLIAVVAVFAFSYLPVHWYHLKSAFEKGREEEEVEEEEIDMNWIALSKLTPRFFSYSSSCLNPILYNFMCGRFRKEFARVVFCRPVKGRDNTLRYTTQRLHRQNNGLFNGRALCSSIGHGTLVKSTLSSSMDSLTKA
ncbi:unnamed protein product, partial [Mesorhabditis spiculigera]